jgi:hypothetical protein
MQNSKTEKIRLVFRASIIKKKKDGEKVYIYVK